MANPKYYLGVDGGGTKTKALITDESGTVIGRGLAAGSNPHNFPLDLAVENIRLAIANACLEASNAGIQINPHSFEALCIGLAGIDSENDRSKVAGYLGHLPPGHRPFYAKKIILCNDGFVGLKSETDQNWGICLISSTGSNCYGLNEAGTEATAGDWGYLLGDQGSAYTLGIKLIRQVIKEYDGRSKTTKVTELVLKHLGLNQATDLITWAYGGQVPVKEIASLSHVLNDMEATDPKLLQEYLSDTSDALIDSYRAVIQRLDMCTQAFPVVCIGGLFNLNLLQTTVKAEIVKITPNAQVIISTHSPAEGAVKIAQMENVSELFPQLSIHTDENSG